MHVNTQSNLSEHTQLTEKRSMCNLSVSIYRTQSIIWQVNEVALHKTLFSFLPLPSGSSVFFTTAMILLWLMLLAMAQVNKKDYIAIVHSDEISYGYPRVEMAKKRIHSDGVLGRNGHVSHDVRFPWDDTAIIKSWRWALINYFLVNHGRMLIIISIAPLHGSKRGKILI